MGRASEGALSHSAIRPSFLLPPFLHFLLSYFLSPLLSTPLPLLFLAVIPHVDSQEGQDIQDFLKALGELQIEGTGVERRFNDHFRIFVKLWKGILSEKKELNAKQAELAKVRSQLDAIEKKARKAEVKVSSFLLLVP